MSLTQYVYFAISSVGTTADEITQLLGVEPDEVTVRGSLTTSLHNIPFCHCWKVFCREPGLRVDELDLVNGRLRPHMEAITNLTTRLATEEGPGVRFCRSSATSTGMTSSPLARRTTRTSSAGTWTAR